MKKRILSLALVLAMATSLVACGGSSSSKSESESGDGLSDYWSQSSEIYDAALGDFYSMYQDALSADNNSERWAKMALSEAKLLESGVMLPLTSDGGALGMSRAAYHTADFALWGVDMYRYYNTLVATDFIKASDRDKLVSMWSELKGTGTYRAEAEKYLKSQGYSFTDEYGLGYTAAPQTWDVLATYRAADFRAIVNTYESLTEYDCEGTQQPSLATSWEVSDDGLTYTFHLRDDAKWYDSQGNELGSVTADDFVAGMQHLLDAQGGLEYLAGASGAKILNADEYVAGTVTDFSEVGVKAVDDTTVEYTLSEANPYFMTMLTYAIFAPMNRDYFESQGGVFGVNEYASANDAGTVTYGTAYDKIAYCGRYIVTTYADTQIVFTKNDKFYDADSTTITKINWTYNDGSVAKDTYDLAISGKVTGISLDPSTVEMAKNDGLYDTYSYISDTDATTFNSWYNLNRTALHNFNDESVGVSSLSEDQLAVANAAMQNQNFRLALSFSIDRASYNETTSGEAAKYASLRNTYVPYNFVYLEDEVTVDINGTATTFAAGTCYGEILQAQIDADGYPIKAYDATANNGTGSGDGYDGWYNVDNAKEYMAKAIEELKADGTEISADNPVVLELPAYSASETYLNRANVMKQCIEEAFDGQVKVELLEMSTPDDWYYAGYYADNGYDNNYNIYDVSGWGPDYGDPATYLNTMRDEDGDMVHLLGIY